MKIMAISFLLLSLSVYQQAEANDCASIKIISRIEPSNEKVKIVGVKNPEVNHEEIEYDLKINPKNIYKNDYSFKSEEQQDVKVNFNENSSVSSTLKDKSSQEIQNIIAAIKKSLLNKGYNVVDSNADVLIILSHDYLYYDSISGDSFNKIEYSIESKGKMVYSGVFSQDEDCKSFFGFSKCKSKKIAEKLSKKILVNLKELCNERRKIK